MEETSKPLAVDGRADQWAASAVMDLGSPMFHAALLLALRESVAVSYTHLIDDAGVLADGALADGGQARAGQDLRPGVAGWRAGLPFVGASQVRDVVGRVVATDVLQRAGDGVDQVLLADAGHGRYRSVRGNAVRSVRGFRTAGVIRRAG